MISNEAIEFGISAVVGAGVSMTMSRHGLTWENSELRWTASAVGMSALIIWLISADLVLH